MAFASASTSRIISSSSCRAQKSASIGRRPGSSAAVLKHETGSPDLFNIVEPEIERRQPRASPAALLGSKRIGLVAVHDDLNASLQTQVAESDTIALRQAYISLQAHLYPLNSNKHRGKQKYHKIESSPALALAKATTQMPGQYAVLVNIFRELEVRLGDGWLEGEVLEVGGTGSGVWAFSDCQGLLQDVPSPTEITGWHFVQTSKDSLSLATGLSTTLSLPFPLTHTRRVAAFTTSTKPALILSPFHLSTLPTPSARAQHLTTLLSLEPDSFIIIDRATDEGWSAISAARSQVLASGSWHIVAPCPHDQACPLAPSGKADQRQDKCRFSQRLQTPETMRKTKHSKRGDEDLMYSYVVFKRGHRPVPTVRGHGRRGGVAREIERIERLKNSGKVELKEVNDGETVEFVQETPTLREEDLPEVEEGNAEEERKGLMEEAYHWPRLVLPPLKRTGHVVMDTCHPSGEIVRMTIPRSLSKQAYHDARKSAWGDLFPHEPKGALVLRTGKDVVIDEGEKGSWPVASAESALEAGKESTEEHGTGGDVFVRTYG